MPESERNSATGVRTCLLRFRGPSPFLLHHEHPPKKKQWGYTHWALRNEEYPFIVITPRSFLTRSGWICAGFKSHGMNQCRTCQLINYFDPIDHRGHFSLLELLWWRDIQAENEQVPKNCKTFTPNNSLERERAGGTHFNEFLII